MLRIEDSGEIEIDYMADTLRWEDAINQRGVASWSTGKDDATFPIEEGEDVFIVEDRNLILYSEDADNWVGEGVTITDDFIVAPDGKLTAAKIQADGADSTHRAYSVSAANEHDGSETTYTASAHVKKGDATWVWVGEGGGASFYRVWFDVDNLVFGTIVNADNYGFEDEGDGWYRVWVIYTDSSATHQLRAYCAAVESDGNDGSAHSLFGYFWGLQIGRGGFVSYGKTEGGFPKLWGGTIDSFTETDIQKTALTYRRIDYEATDFDQIASKRHVAAVYEEMTAGAIVSDLITNFLDGENVTEGVITAGPTITFISFNYKFVSDALDELSEMAGFDWKIDLNKQLQFKARSETTAPFSIDSSNKDYLRISRTKKRTDYRNVQFIRGGFQQGSGLVEEIAGDGNTRAFLVSELIQVVTGIMTNIAGAGFAAKTFDLRGEAGSDFYYQTESHTINQDSGGVVLNAADLIQITYDSKTPIVAIDEDEPEITARAALESGSGRYEHVLVDQNIAHEDTAVDKAAALLERFGQIPEIITLETDTSGLEAGQLIEINLTDMNCSGQYLIEKVVGFDRGNYDARFSVRALSGQAFGGWLAFFKSLETSGASFVIRENEVLYLIRTARETVAVTDQAIGRTSTSFGFTIGDTRTNLFLRSEEFNNASWTKIRSSVSADSVLSPTGLTTADTLTEDATAGDDHTIRQGPTVVDATSYIISVFAKAKERTWISLHDSIANEGRYFDLANGVLGSVNPGAPDDSGIVYAGDGWYRCWITLTSASTTINAILFIAEADGVASYNGDGSSGVYIWGGQLEKGSDLPSDYIVTVGSTASQDWGSKLGLVTWG